MSSQLNDELELIAQKLFSEYRPAGSKVWTELNEEEKWGWRKVAIKFYELEMQVPHA